MDRVRLLATSPGHSALPQLHVIAQMHEVIAFALRVLDAVDADGRDLDEWEADRLLCALGAIHSDLFGLALACVERALTEPSARAPGWHAGVNVAPTARLRDAFKQARFRAIGHP